MQHQKPRSNQSRDQLPCFTNLSSNVTNSYQTSVFKQDFSPRRHLTACSSCHELGAQILDDAQILDT